ncbi:MAG: peptidoglycan DD-metalloendopeptidase family protein [Clostridia bacterium]|nr:peptidoglycan DD-metalloendopeptidase family protein [Clostridia bacterium]
MNFRNKRSGALLTTLVMVIGISALLSSSQPAFGNSSLQDKLNQAAESKKQAQANRTQSQAKLSSTMEQVTKLDNEAEVISAQLAEIDRIIEEAEAKIAQKEEEIAEYERQIEENEVAFCARLRAMDETNAMGYVDLLVNSQSLSDFVARIETIREITEHDQGIINEMISLKEGVEASRNELVAYRNEQQEARSLVQSKQNELNAKIAEKQSYIKSLEKDIAKYDSLYKAAAAEEESLKRSIAGSSSTGTVGSSGRITYSGGVFCWPAPSYTYVSSEFGYRIHPVYGTKKYHSGIDLAAPGGSPILAAADGTVKFAGWNGGYGYCIILDHGGGIQTLYGHSSKLLVSAGQKVTRGQKIALVGTTGTSTGNHLHFEVLNNGTATNPRPYLQ